MRPLPALVCAYLSTAVIVSGCSGAPAGQTESPIGEPSASPTAGTPSPSPVRAETDETTAPVDFYCDAADDGAIALGDLLDATDRKSAETGMDGNAGDAAAMRSAGEDMLTAMDAVVQAWSTAAERIGTDPWADADAPVTNGRAHEAYAEYFEYLDAFARPEARIAAQSATIEQYSVETAALLAEPSTIMVASEGAAALNDILGYHVARCGDVPLN